jgi:hypothetical protein
MESMERYHLSRKFAMLPSNEHLWKHASPSAKAKAQPQPQAAPEPLDGFLFNFRTQIQTNSAQFSPIQANSAKIDPLKYFKVPQKRRPSPDRARPFRN